MPHFPILEITPTLAEKIYRILTAFADAPPELRKAFVHHMSTLKQGEFRIDTGRYGATCFFIDNNEWFVTTTSEDETISTRNVLDTTNLKLALLRDDELP